MGLIGALGLKNAGKSIVQILADLVGQNLVVNRLTANAAATPINAPNGPVTATNFVATAASTGLDVAATGRLTFGGANYISNVGGTGGMTASGGFDLTTGTPLRVASAAMFNTAPTISSGFGAGASIVASNGTAAFTINVGAASATGVIALPAVTTGWAVHVQNLTTNTATVFLTKQTGAGTTTTVPIGNYDAAGASQNWVANDILLVCAVAY